MAAPSDIVVEILVAPWQPLWSDGGGIDSPLLNDGGGIRNRLWNACGGMCSPLQTADS